ncbi:hypothetical protein HDZ31DRAFT_50352 [Schizophyllum fasciatum]
MQVMKKTVATKLVAEKMEPPTMHGARVAAPDASLSTPQGHKRTSSGPINFIKGGWMSHKRALSHGTKKTKQGDEVGSPHPEKENMVEGCSAFPHRHRRGASVPGIASELSPACAPSTPTPFHMPRHIIPREQLAEIMNRRASVASKTPSTHKMTRSSSIVITPLGPKPRRKVDI